MCVYREVYICAPCTCVQTRSHSSPDGSRLDTASGDRAEEKNKDLWNKRQSDELKFKKHVTAETRGS